MKFSFSARTKSGDKVTDTVEARDRNSAIREVMRLGYVPITITADTGTLSSTQPQPLDHVMSHGQDGTAAHSGNRQNASESQARGALETKGRHGCVTAWLGFIVAMSLVLVWVPWAMRPYNRWTLLEPFCFSALSMMGLVSVIAVFRGKKWGVCALLVVAVGWTLLSGYLAKYKGAAIGSHGVAGAIIVGTLYGLLQLRRRGVSGWSHLEGGHRPVVFCLFVMTLLVSAAPAVKWVQQQKADRIEREQEAAFEASLVGRWWYTDGAKESLATTLGADHKFTSKYFVILHDVDLPLHTITGEWSAKGRVMTLISKTVSSPNLEITDPTNSFVILYQEESKMALIPEGGALAGTERIWKRVKDAK